MSNRPSVECWLTDMDGVLVHENQALPGAAEFLQRLNMALAAENPTHLFVTMVYGI
ncbi:MAG TPA: hypothetical protein VF714_02770, partial [Jatrophihabitans sp.]